MRNLAYSILVLLIASCGSSVPENVLPPDKMQAVLWDVMQADELAEYNTMKDSSFASLAKHAGYYQNVLSIHKISKKQFTLSLNYYERNPELLKKVLDSLQSFGERMQQNLENNKSMPSPNPDTLLKRNDSMRRKGAVSRRQ